MIIPFVAAIGLAIANMLGYPRLLVKRNTSPLSREITSAVNGLFIIFVFLNHGITYIPKEALSSFDFLFLKTGYRLGQMIVTTFLLFSGYGIMESIIKKEGYVGKLPMRRILPFVVDVFIALVPYLVIRIWSGNTPTLDHFLLAVIGRKSIGNSNWYIFAILCMYILTWISFCIARTAGQGLSLVFLGCILYILVLWHDSPGVDHAQWYDTILCYPCGMLLSYMLNKGKIILVKGAKYTAIGICIIIIALLYSVKEPRPIVHNIYGVFFAMMITLFVFDAKYISIPLKNLGENLFYIYIYQRIFMIILNPLAGYGSVIYLATVGVILLLWCNLIKRLHCLMRKTLFDSSR